MQKTFKNFLENMNMVPIKRFDMSRESSIA